jgi:hypothetical protein
LRCSAETAAFSLTPSPVQQSFEAARFGAGCKQLEQECMQVFIGCKQFRPKFILAVTAIEVRFAYDG